jgi:hypothetical protein
MNNFQDVNGNFRSLQQSDSADNKELNQSISQNPRCLSPFPSYNPERISQRSSVAFGPYKFFTLQSFFPCKTLSESCKTRRGTSEPFLRKLESMFGRFRAWDYIRLNSSLHGLTEKLRRIADRHRYAAEGYTRHKL